MSLSYQVLGRPGRDNAVYVKVDTGQAIYRILCDCGEHTVSRLPRAEVQSVDHLLLSHFHLDHVAGFDSFFRSNYNRKAHPVEVWGPEGTIDRLQHRFLSFWWNLHRRQPGVWHVHDIHEDRVEESYFRTSEAFGRRHAKPPQAHDGIILSHGDFFLEAMLLRHRGVSIGYRIRESDRQHVDVERMEAMGLKPGPWLKRLKDGKLGRETVDGRDAETLERELLRTSPGESLAYLTDFLLDEPEVERLGTWLEGTDTLICESQYCHADEERARKNHHLTSVWAARLAARAGVGKLCLFHVSDRYGKPEWKGMLDEAREVFPATVYPENWSIG